MGGVQAALLRRKLGGDGLECGREVHADQLRASFAHMQEGGGDQYGEETIFDGRESGLIVDKAAEQITQNEILNSQDEAGS